MISRFSSELFEHPQSGEPAEDIGAVQMSSDLGPLTERDLVTDCDVGDMLVVEVPSCDLTDVFVPDQYEPNYAYPLLVWLETSRLAPSRLDRRMRQISDRNYFGVSIEVTDSGRIEEQLHETFLRLRRKFHLNTERVYLLGCGAAGTQALATGLSQPGCFGGIAALSSSWPEVPRLLSQYDELRGKRVLLGVSEADDAALLADAAYGARLLWSAGMHVTTLTTTAGGEPHRALLREIDHWVMQGIEQPEFVY
jgi:phospholipase/carboxylesterase